MGINSVLHQQLNVQNVRRNNYPLTLFTPTPGTSNAESNALNVKNQDLFHETSMKQQHFEEFY